MTDQKGLSPIFLLCIAGLATILFFIITQTGPFKNGMLSTLYPKTPSQAAGTPVTFLETFDEDPKNPDGTFVAKAPTPWNKTNWSKRFDVYALDTDSWGREAGWEQTDDNPMAHHGGDCSAPLNVHEAHDIYNDVYNCRNHIMTSIVSGYSNVYLTPNHMVDFSNGEAVISWDVSTFTTSRDWISVTVTPWEDSITQPQMICCNGEPKRGILMTGDGESFRTHVIKDYKAGTAMWGGSISQGMCQYFPTKYCDPQQAAAQRQTYELRISKTHIKFGMPKLGLVFVDRDIDPLDWDKGTVQWTHHAYNPQKDCTPTGDPTNCAANTWHWDNFKIEPAIPFTMIKGDTLGMTKYSASKTINFEYPAPVSSYLRFGGVGDFQVSFNNGQTYTPALVRLATANAPEHFKSYATPVPPGTTKVTIQGSGGPNGRWILRNPQIWSLASMDPNATPVPTPSPIPSPTPPPPGAVTVNFDDKPSVALIGEYPFGVIHWGDSKWVVSEPWKKLTTKSFSFNGNGINSGTFTLVQPRALASITAYNGGTVASTITLKCGSNPDKTQVVAIDELVTINTGWSTPCQLITLSSTNGWNTNFDNLALGPASQVNPTMLPSPSVSPTPAITPIPTPTPTASPNPTPVPTTSPSSTPAPKSGDLNNDTVVNALDFAILLSKWGSNDPVADLNGDGSVGLVDFSILLSKWGT